MTMTAAYDSAQTAAETRARIPTLTRYGFEIEAMLMQLMGASIRSIPAGPTNLRAYEATGLPRRGETAEDVAARPVLVVQHGIGARASEFAPLVPRFRRMARRVVFLDLPAHGFSGTFPTAHRPEDLFAAWVDALRNLVPEPAVYCGNSLGGGMALRLARDHPQHVAGLVLLSPAGAMMSHAELEEVLSTFRFETLDEVAAFLRRLFANPPSILFLPLVLHAIRVSFERPFMRDLLAALSPDDLFTPAELGRMAIPTLLIWGEHDRILPRPGYDYLREHLPAATLTAEIMPGVAHVPQLEQPRKLLDRVTGWLEEQAPAMAARGE